MWKMLYILSLIFIGNSSSISSFAVEPFTEYHQGQWFLWLEDLSYAREDYQWYIHNSGQPSKLYQYENFVREDFGGLYQTEISQLLELKTNKIRMPYVGLIDSGCFTNHIELTGMIVKAINYSVGQNPNDISDLDGHGTAMAGVISAKINGEGIRGIANAPILLTKTRMAARSTTEIDEIAVSIIWLSDNGARVIILPWGTKYYSENLKQACLYAAENDIVIVCSLPNEIGTLGVNNLIDYPSSFCLNNILSVYNIDRNGSLYHSVYSSNAIGSPGRIIVTLAPNNWYTYTSGTSISAGIAGSVAIVLRSMFPNATAPDIVSAMKLNYNLKAFQSSQALLLLYPQTNNIIPPVRYKPPFGSLPVKQLKEKRILLN